VADTERKWYDYLLNPTEEEKLEVKEKLDQAFKVQRGIEKFGFDKFLEKVVEEKQLKEGKSPEEIVEAKEQTRAYLKDLKNEDIRRLIQESELDDTQPEKKSKPEIKVGDKVIQAGVNAPAKVGFEEDELSEIGIGESVGNAIVSGTIKIPLGFVNLSTLLYDAFQDADIPVDKSLTAKVTAAFDRSIIGVMARESEEKARETATGRIVEAIVQLYGAGKFAGKPAAKVMTKITNKARGMADKIIDAMKNNRYVSTSGNINALKAAKEAKRLNKLSNFDKFVGVTVGGGIGTAAVVMKAEDIGTFGDMFDVLPTEMDRKQRASGADDAARQLMNKFKFGAELGFPIIPAAYGVSKVAKLAVQRGKYAQFSNSEIERWMDKFLLQPFRSRSYKHQAIFEGAQKLEGRQAGIKLLADDFIRSIDDSLKRISKTSGKAAQAVDDNTVSQMLARFIMSSKDVVKKGKIAFEGFTPKVLKDFTESMKKIGIASKDISKMVDDAIDFRSRSAELKREILSGGNINVGASKFNDILDDRIRNFLSYDYKIFDKNVGWFTGFKPTQDMKDQVAKVFQRYARANGVKLDEGQAATIVDDIVQNVRMDKLGGPEFVMPKLGLDSVLADKTTQLKNIAANITKGKFTADKNGGLIQTVSDLQAFNKLFGKYQDAKRMIYNVMQDLGSVIARDKFYNRLLKESDAFAKRGDSPIFRNSYQQALNAFKGKPITPDGIKAVTRLGEELYTSPIDGKFTTKEWAEAIRLGDEIAMSPLTKSFIYRNLVLIPKGLAQMSKTVLGPFTHSRNFFSAALTALHRGNIFINPMKIIEFAGTSRRTIQPQMMYRITGNPKWRNTKQDQALYKFLLDEGVTNQSATYRDVMGIWEDIAKGGNFWSRSFNSLGKTFKGVTRVARDLYVAEDDYFRVFNFLAEGHKLREAFKAAVKNKVKVDGKLVKMPDDYDIMREAADIVRATVPNYSRVSDFIKGVRRSPLGNYASFPAEIVRTTLGATRRGIYEAKDPIRRTIGLRGMLGQGMTYGVVPIGVYEGVRGLYGITREKVAAIREILPSWSQDSTILPVYEDGKYKYIDFSHGFFYDTMTNPVQSVLAQVDAKPEEPLVTGLVHGITRATARFMEPFISESIWFSVLNDILIRNGVTRDGRRIFNPRDKWHNKVWESWKHTAYTLSPGSLPQLTRLYKASIGDTINGVQYEVPDELAGFFGFRQVPLDLNKTLNFKIQEFKRDERNERNLIYKGTLTGDPVKDKDLIIKQFVLANEQRLETFNKMRRIYDAVKVLGMRDKEIAKEFSDRGAIKLYAFIRKNRFKPFTISKGMGQAYADLAREKGIENVLDRDTRREINRIIKKLYRQRLNKDFRIKIEDHIDKKSLIDKILPGDQSQAPLPATPMPKVTQIPAQINPQTGLTRTESALLSPSEQVIARRT
jgi:hypothetical protein